MVKVKAKTIATECPFPFIDNQFPLALLHILPAPTTPSPLSNTRLRIKTRIPGNDLLGLNLFRLPEECQWRVLLLRQYHVAAKRMRLIRERLDLGFSADWSSSFQHDQLRPTKTTMIDSALRRQICNQRNWRINFMPVKKEELGGVRVIELSTQFARRGRLKVCQLDSLSR